MNIYLALALPLSLSLSGGKSLETAIVERSSTNRVLALSEILFLHLAVAKLDTEIQRYRAVQHSISSISSISKTFSKALRQLRSRLGKVHNVLDLDRIESIAFATQNHIKTIHKYTRSARTRRYRYRYKYTHPQDTILDNNNRKFSRSRWRTWKLCKPCKRK